MSNKIHGKIILLILIASLIAVLASCKNSEVGDGTDTVEATEEVQVDTTAPVTEPPATEPPATEPPATEPPATEPPVTEPPATEPPATEPPATEPPATEPPATEPPATEPPATEPPATEPPATEPPATEPPATEPTIDTGYLDIETVKSRLSADRYLGKNDDSLLLKLRVPKQWSIVSTGESNYEIVRESETVGEIHYSESGEDHADCLYHEDFSLDGISVSYCIFKDSGWSSGYKRVYTYKYTAGGKETVFSITVDYANINDYYHKRFTAEVTLEDIIYNSGFSSLTLGMNETKPILILGNSFITTSDIDLILDAMLNANGKRITAETSWLSNINGETYLADENCLKEIKRGNYSAVFVCGFYEHPSVAAFAEFVEACEYSDTMLAIFPAHNESDIVISSAMSEYGDIPVIHWKNEIDMLIKGEHADRWDMCIDDAHDHSTPLAGYVGAHMIYRALFGEVPRSFSYYNDTAGGYSAQAEKMFPEYVKTGNISVVAEKYITRFGG